MKKKFRIYIILGLIISIAAIIDSCSTKKNTAMRRGYHNLTAYFNVYFNGEDSYKIGMMKIDQLPENYTRILPMYKSDLEKSKETVSSDMDRAITKAYKAIETHSITAKPKRKSNAPMTDEEKEFMKKPEYCKYIDDAYVLMGKSHLYIQDYKVGLKSLQLVLNKFKDEETRFDAMYWIARINIGMKDYTEAMNYLELLQTDKYYPEKKFARPVQIAKIDLDIKQENYSQAIPELEKLISETKWWKRKEKVRYMFILAQLYQENGDKPEAMETYRKLLKKNPAYEMAFTAKMNMAKSFSADAGNADELKKILSKMLKDDKNIEFQDQIYYALSEISLAEKDTSGAVSFLEASIKASTNNPDQKALSYLSLADIYFTKAKPDYINAGAYYDSTMTVLSKDFPKYEEVKEKAETLSGLITNIKIIEREDSLQRVAQMPEKEREVLISNIITDLKNKEAEEKNGPVFTGNDPFGIPEYTSENTKGKWYFYNPTAVSVGKDEFKKKWGDRKNEDHWRRKNKASIIKEDEEETADTTERVTDNKKPEFYMQDLPLTDSLLEVSNTKIVKAMYNVGNIYDRQMNDNEEAVLSYEKLIERFPKDKIIVEVYFNLYMLHYKETGNTARAEYYRNKILTEFPYSKYAKILQNPNYLKTLQDNMDKINALYATAYKAYNEKKYDLVLSSYKESEEISPDNDLTPKFMFLQALVAGETDKKYEMKTSLEEIVKKYPDDEITPRAKNILEVLETGKFDHNLFKYEENANYYYSLLVPNDTTLINKVLFKIVGFNVSIFPDKDLKIEQLNFDEDRIQLIVKAVSGKTEAMNYYNNLKTKNILQELPSGTYKDYMISPENFEKLQKVKYIEKYLEFFDKNLMM